MPSLKHPYNYCERDDGAATWAAVTEHEMRLRKFQTHTLTKSFGLMSLAFRRLSLTIGGTQDA